MDKNKKKNKLNGNKYCGVHGVAISSVTGARYTPYRVYLNGHRYIGRTWILGWW